MATNYSYGLLMNNEYFNWKYIFNLSDNKERMASPCFWRAIRPTHYSAHICEKPIKSDGGPVDTLLQGTLHPSLTPLRRVCIYWLCVAACPEHRGNQSAPIGEGQAGWVLPDGARLWCHRVRRAPTGASFSYLAYINLASNREAFQIKVFRLFMSWLKKFTKI